VASGWIYDQFAVASRYRCRCLCRQVGWKVRYSNKIVPTPAKYLIPYDSLREERYLKSIIGSNLRNEGNCSAPRHTPHLIGRLTQGVQGVPRMRKLGSAILTETVSCRKMSSCVPFWRDTWG
jgi:hypothetical protein